MKDSKGLLLGTEVTKLLLVAIFLWHGIPKALDPPFAIDKFVGYGLPGILGPITGWVEVIAAPLLYVRAAQRGAIVVLATIILGALITVQLPNGITSGLERDLLILAALGVLAFSGPGAFGIGRPRDGLPEAEPAGD